MGVGIVERGAVPDGDVQRAVRSEGQGSPYVRQGVSLQEILFEAVDHGLRGGARVDVAVRRHGAGEERVGEVVPAAAADVVQRAPRLPQQDDLAPGHDRGVAGRRVQGVAEHLGVAVAGAVRARVSGQAGRPARVHDREDVQVRVVREVGVERDVHQSAVSGVVHPGAEVEDGAGRAGCDVGDFDDARLLADVDARGVHGREVEFDWQVEAADDRDRDHVVVGHQRRLRRRRRRGCFVVEDRDPRGARGPERAAFDVDQREGEDLGALGRGVVQQPHLDRRLGRAGRHRDRTEAADEILPFGGGVRRNAVGDPHLVVQRAVAKDALRNEAGAFGRADFGLVQENRAVERQGTSRL